MIVLDAGVLIGLLNEYDAYHMAAFVLLRKTAPPYTVHPLTAAEVLVGPARAGREEEVWRDLRGIGVTVAQLGDDEPLLLARLRAEYRLKMPDTCVLVTAAHYGVPLMTFDQQLAGVAQRLALLYPDLS